MPQGRREVPIADRARFWQCMSSGMTIKDSAQMAGIAYVTATKWVRKQKVLEAKAELANFNEKTKGAPRNGQVLREAHIAMSADMHLPPVIPDHLLTERALKAREDFDYFRRVYLGRVPSPWQVDAAYKIVQYLESEEKEFLCLNVAPGAGKSTLFHDVAVWCIVRNRSIRILIGSISQSLAKQYSRRIRDTLERTSPLEPDPELVRRGLALNAEGCLAFDFGRFKPTATGSLWRAEEFVVEQSTPGGLDNKEPTVSAYGIESEFIGHRADLCLFDDVASPENAKDSVARDRLIERWDSMAEARVDPGGVLAVVGQRLGPKDLYAHCLSKISYDDFGDNYDGSDVTTDDNKPDPDAVEPVKHSKYHHIIYKAYYEELDTGPESRKTSAKAWPEGPLLDPYRLSWKDLSYIRYNNPGKFRVVYQQEDAEQDDALIDRVWVTGGIGSDGVMYHGCIDQDRLPGHIPPGLSPPLISICSVDPSPTQFWAVEWWLYQPDLNLYHLVDCERIKLTAEELLGYNISTSTYSGIMEEWQNRSMSMGYPISHWIVEINAAQRFLLAHDFVRRWQAEHGVLVVPHTTSKNKLDETLGVEALIPTVVRSGSVRLPTMRGNWKTLALVDEMTTWTRDKTRGTDMVMAMWFMLLHAPKLTKPILPPRQWRPSWMLEK
jgi:hypothetical protein